MVWGILIAPVVKSVLRTRQGGPTYTRVNIFLFVTTSQRGGAQNVINHENRKSVRGKDMLRVRSDFGCGISVLHIFPSYCVINTISLLFRGKVTVDFQW